MPVSRQSNKIGACQKRLFPFTIHNMWVQSKGELGMTAAFDKLKTALAEKKTLTDDEVAKIIAEHGELTADESTWLAAELHERNRASQQKVTLEQFLEANKILDTADPNSDEYKNAEKIAEAYLQGG